MTHRHPFQRPLRVIATGALVALAAAAGTPAWAGVAEVRFVDSERFADIGRSNVDRQRTMDTLRAHFELLAQRQALC